MTPSHTPIGIIGCGTMGRGIAQVAAAHGHTVRAVDSHAAAREQAAAYLDDIATRLVAKGKMSDAEAAALIGRIRFSDDMGALADCGLVIEAVVERLDVKRTLFERLEDTVAPEAILASNTSSLSIAAISGALRSPGRFLGIHFFNPAPVMKLVEIVPGVATAAETVAAARAIIDGWGKVSVIARDTPGFIVNRVARPFYGEALRILDEGIADAATIDWAMTELGGFRMGPFTLMDFIGNDINFAVTESVFTAFYYDPRYRPSFTQKRLVEAGRLGRKSGLGFYDYRDGAANPEPVRNAALGETVLERVRAMLINEAVDALFWGIASAADIDRAMRFGVNYPRGLLAWADELGAARVFHTLRDLQERYGEDRYRPSPLLRRHAEDGAPFITPESHG